MNITVVITNYNHRESVGAAIESAIGQTVGRRIVVVDDASTDNSMELYRTYAGHIQVIRKEQTSSPAFAKNAGIKHAWEKTDVFSFLDADDSYAHENALAKLTEPFVTSDKVGLVYADCETSYRVYRESFAPERFSDRDIVGGNYAVTKAALAATGGFDVEMKVWENYELAKRISQRFILIHVPESLFIIGRTGRGMLDAVGQDEWQYYWNRANAQKPAAA